MNSPGNPFGYQANSGLEKITAQMSRPNYILAALITVIILMAVTFSYTAWQHGNDKINLQLASEMRLHTFEISRHSTQASTATVTAFPLLQASDYRLNEILTMFDKGEPSIGLQAASGTARENLEAIQAVWPDISMNTNIILREEGIIRMMKEFVSALNALTPEFQGSFDKSISILRKGRNNQESIHYLGELKLLTQRIDNHANRLLLGNGTTENLTEKLKRDSEKFIQLYLALAGKKQDRQVTRISNRSALKAFRNTDISYETWKELTRRIEEVSPQLIDAQQAANTVYAQTENLLILTNSLLESYTRVSNSRSLGNFVGYSLGIVALALLITLGMSITRTTRARLRQEKNQNQRTQNAILTLLDELAPLADGDLRTQTTVSEEITGAIADAINYVVNELRTTVAQILEMSQTVSEHAQDTQATTLQLSQASATQTEQLVTASDNIQSITDSIEQISVNASECTDVAQQSVLHASQGATAVSNTIESMNALQNNIKATAITIKRLGESSQEIGDIIELIQDIAEQTNILALNAAIQAHNSGQNNRDIKDLSEDIHQLASRVSESTHKIETLISTIQSDTQSAVRAMEDNTSSISKTMMLATRTGKSLLKIEEVSRQLARLVNQISGSASKINSEAHEVNDSMSRLRKFTQQNLAGTRHSAELTGELSKLAIAQKHAVARFKLPESIDLTVSMEKPDDNPGK